MVSAGTNFKIEINFVLVKKIIVFFLAFIDMPELLTYMRQNYIRWKEFDEQGHTTLADIQKLQSTVLMCPMIPSKSSTTEA